MPRLFAAAPGDDGPALEKRDFGNEGGNDLLDRLHGVGQFLSSFQRRLRFGRASRLPLQLLRLELQGDTLECDWSARPSDTWDADLPRHVSARNAAFQALEDALAVRQLVFSTFPDIRRAVLRAYRGSIHPAGLIIEGKVLPGETPAKVLSPTMRAKLNGFRFCIENGVLWPLLAD
jgi:hypothetical protein